MTVSMCERECVYVCVYVYVCVCVCVCVCESHLADRVVVDWNERLGVDVLEVPAERLALHLLLEREPLHDAAVVGGGRARVHHRVEHACAQGIAAHRHTFHLCLIHLCLCLRRSARRTSGWRLAQPPGRSHIEAHARTHARLNCHATPRPTRDLRHAKRTSNGDRRTRTSAAPRIAGAHRQRHPSSCRVLAHSHAYRTHMVLVT